jgi:putative ABC transport system permease protein
MQPRWKKVLRDLIADPTRTMLVVLSIAVGVFALGTILTTRIVLAEQLRSSYLAINPASATITTEPFDAILLDTVRNVPGVAEAQGLRAVPADSAMFAPRIAAGRWLLPDDTGAVVLTSNYRLKHPGVQVGDEVVFTIDATESSWRIVCFVDELTPPTTPASGYVPLNSFTALVGTYGRTDTLRVATVGHDAVSHAAASSALEQQLTAADFDLQQLRSRSDDRAALDTQFAVLVGVLTMMALLVGGVGGLGLSGAMSINVLERTREIGVLRAIGASNGAVRQIVLSEGLVVALLAWLIGAALSLPLSALMSVALGLALLNTALTWVYSFSGALIWLGIVLLIAVCASLLPARSAVRLTIREVLAYE